MSKVVTLVLNRQKSRVPLLYQRQDCLKIRSPQPSTRSSKLRPIPPTSFVADKWWRFLLVQLYSEKNTSRRAAFAIDKAALVRWSRYGASCRCEIDDNNRPRITFVLSDPYHVNRFPASIKSRLLASHHQLPTNLTSVCSVPTPEHWSSLVLQQMAAFVGSTPRAMLPRPSMNHEGKLACFTKCQARVDSSLAPALVLSD